MKNPEILSSLAQEKIASIYASNIVVNITFESGQSLIVTPRNDGGLGMDVEVRDGDRVVLCVGGQAGPGPIEGARAAARGKKGKRKARPGIDKQTQGWIGVIKDS